MDSNETKKCNSCEITKSHAEFHMRNDKHKNIPRSICKMCWNNKNFARRNTDDGFLNHLYYSAKNRAKYRTNNERSEAGKFSINKQDIFDLYESQNGKCYYSGLTLVLRPLSDYMASLERLDVNRGYVLGNVVMICFEFQGASQWSEYKFDVFCDLLNRDHEPNIVNFNLEENKLISPMKRIKKIYLDDVEHIICNKCDVAQTRDNFVIGLYKGCIKCRSDERKIDHKKPRNHLLKLFNNIRVRCKTKSLKYEIDFQFLVDLFHKQDGLCAYSNIPLQFGSHYENWFSTSIERKDTSKGYTKDNVCLIIYELNTSDNTSRAVNPVTGSGAWSIEKIEFFKNNCWKMISLENLKINTDLFYDDIVS